MDIEKYLKEILYNDIQDCIEFNDIFNRIEETLELSFITFKIDNEIILEEDEYLLSLIEKGKEHLKLIASNVSNSVGEYQEILNELNGNKEEKVLTDYVYNLKAILDTQSFILDWYKPEKTVINKGKGTTTVQVEYSLIDGGLVIEDYTVKFDYRVEEGGDEDITIESIVTSKFTP